MSRNDPVTASQTDEKSTEIPKEKRYINWKNTANC